MKSRKSLFSVTVVALIGMNLPTLVFAQDAAQGGAQSANDPNSNKADATNDDPSIKNGSIAVLEGTASAFGAAKTSQINFQNEYDAAMKQKQNRENIQATQRSAVRDQAELAARDPYEEYFEAAYFRSQEANYVVKEEARARTKINSHSIPGTAPGGAGAQPLVAEAQELGKQEQEAFQMLSQRTNLQYAKSIQARVDSSIARNGFGNSGYPYVSPLQRIDGILPQMYGENYPPRPIYDAIEKAKQTLNKATPAEAPAAQAKLDAAMKDFKAYEDKVQADYVQERLAYLKNPVATPAERQIAIAAEMKDTADAHSASVSEFEKLKFEAPAYVRYLGYGTSLAFLADAVRHAYLQLHNSKVSGAALTSGKGSLGDATKTAGSSAVKTTGTDTAGGAGLNP